MKSYKFYFLWSSRPKNDSGSYFSKKFWKEAFLHYEKLLKTYRKVQVYSEKTFYKDFKDSKNEFWFFCDTQEKKSLSLSSLEMSQKIDSLDKQFQSIHFVVGRHSGFTSEDYKLIDSSPNKAYLNLSKGTFPHELFSVILIEQVYRSLSIVNKHPYHGGH